MLKYNITLAIRHLLRNPFHTFINLFGLILGVTASWFVFSYVAFESSFDSFFEDSDRIYRVIQYDESDGEFNTKTLAIVAPTIESEFANVEKAGRVTYINRGTIKLENRGKLEIFNENKIAFADPTLFEILKYPVLQGDPKEALKTQSVIISEDLAIKFFGGAEAAYGKSLNLSFNFGSFNYTVSAVIDFPSNSHLKLNMVFSSEIWDREPLASRVNNWNIMNSYVRISPEANIKDLEDGFKDFVKKTYGDEVTTEFKLQPIKDIYLEAGFGDNENKRGSNQAMQLLSVVSVLILIIAWINYINLTTARATERAHEVGIRKVLGSMKGRITSQFLTETFLINGIAFIISYVVIMLLYPLIEYITGSEIHLIWEQSTWIWNFYGLVFLVGSLISGFYPSMILASYNPVRVLKGKIFDGASNSSLRKGLVGAQFIISGILLLVAVAIFSQVNFMISNDKGVNIENTLIIESPTLGDSTLDGRVKEYMRILGTDSNVEEVTITNIAPGVGFNFGSSIQLLNQEEEGPSAQIGIVDQQYFDFYDIEFVAGRGFTENVTVNQESAVINEEAAKGLGFPEIEEVLGEKIDFPFAPKPLEIVGIVKNYHHFSLKSDIPAMLFVYQEGSNKITTRITYNSENDNINTILSKFEENYKELFPGNAFEYSFLEDVYQQDYKSEEKLGAVISIFTGIALLVSILGIVGLASYSTLRRMKEIGIRKVLGASTQSLMRLISKEFVLVVVLSQIIVIPVAYWISNLLLSDYPYQVNLSLLIFILPLLITGLITVVTILIQTWFGTRVNPAVLLRDE